MVERLDHLAGVGRGDRSPRLPGDTQDHERDQESDDRIAGFEPKRDDDRAADDAEGDKGVDASVVAVCDQGRTR
jgi:hypothetical protein